MYRSTDSRPPGQDYIVLTPDNVNSAYDASEVSFAAYGEQTFEDLLSSRDATPCIPRV